MKHIQELLIGSCFGSDQYERIRFLEPKDFTNYPGKPFREFWKMAQSTSGYTDKLMQAIGRTKNEELINMLSFCAFVPIANNPERAALLLLQYRFKSLFMQLLTDLAMETKNEVEQKLLEEAFLETGRQDIFVITDGIIDYLGLHASESTKRRITAYLTYRDKRVKEAKDVIIRIS